VNLPGSRWFGHFKRLWPAYLVLCVSLAPTAVLYLRMRQITAVHRLGQFNSAIEGIKGRADLHFTYYLALLRGMRGLFAASEEVTPDEFRRYLMSVELRSGTGALHSDHPGLRDLGFAMRVKAGQEQAHILSMRSHGFTLYTPLFLGDGPEHFPIAYLDDLEGAGMVPSGWDAMGDPSRRAALEQARDTGEPVATPPVEIYSIDPAKRAPGFVLYLPVYAQAATPTNLIERREQLIGFAFGSFAHAELWKAIEGEANTTAALMVCDGSELIPERRLYPDPGRQKVQRPAEFIDGYIAQGLGRTWSFFYASRPEFERSPERYVPLATLIGGSLISLGLFGLACVLVRGRRQAERMTAELRASEAKFRGIYETVQDLYFRADLGGVLSRVSPSCRAILGCEPDEILGRPGAGGYVHPPQLEDAFRRILADGKVEDHEVVLRRKGGEVFTASLTAHLVRDPDAKPIAVEGLFRDIEARKRAEAALRESRELYHSLVESLPLGLFRKDVQGRYTYANGAYLALLHRAENQVLGRSDAELLPEGLAAKRSRDEAGVLSTGCRLDVTDEMELTSGDRQRIRTVRSPIRDAAGTPVGLQGLCWDVTEQHRLEAERLRTSKLESVGLLAGGIAHDFNNILTAIIGNMALLRLASPADVEAREQLAEVQRAALRAKDLTQQLLTFAKGGAPVRRAASLAEIIRDSTSFALRGSNVRGEFSLPADLWPVEVDVGQLNQVLHNLVLNAVQAMPEGGAVRIQARNVSADDPTALALPPGPCVHFSLADTGTGIKPDHLPNVFDPYFTTKQHGSGLGLATVYSIIRRHDGRITVESELGRGTTFHVWLPASPLAQLPESHLAERPPRGQGRILVVDDEAPIRALLARSLQKLGYEPECVADGPAALAAAHAARQQQRPFVAAVLDLTIPGGMGGLEILRLLRESAPGLKAIVSSGYSNDPIMANYHAHGFEGVLVKPYQPEDLARALHEVVAAPASQSAERPASNEGHGDKALRTGSPRSTQR
jgi:PAS domain S-box-containing protein